MAARQIHTPDAALDRYANEWLPLQMDWVCSLDRGWPTGMRGSRDSANDFTAMVPLAPAWSRDILLTLFSCQRSDGWFPRQYSAAGRKGKHDLRGHVDAGCWIIELLYTYLCYTKDWSLLDESLPWLDSDENATVLDHALGAIEFYLRDENIGVHGLCKIGEGDWLDTVNRAGVKGRGESVTVTCLAIIAMTQMSAILEHLAGGAVPRETAQSDRKRYAQHCNQFRDNLTTHALNSDGYFNSVFNDEGCWIFSNADGDGQRRVYGPANWFAVSCGAAGEHTDSVLKQMEFLKAPHGYRLYWPPMGKVPIAAVGRAGSGDQPAGLWEHGNVYNQGSHGFLGRALAAAGRGDLLYEVLGYLLPYDQNKHPLAETLSAPYAVVNCWQQVPLFHGRGGMTFLTGSIAYGMRMVHEWMFGVRPTPGGLAVDPCVPTGFEHLQARLEYLNTTVELEIRNPGGKSTGVKEMTLNGAPVTETAEDPFSKRRIFVAPDERFTERVNKLIVTL